MSNFLQQIIPPHFWIFVVLAALVLHVVANYLQRLLDKSLSTGSVVLRLRGLSKPGREKRAARVQQISDWIEGNGDRVTLALAEANFFCLLGFLLLLNAFVGFVAVIVTRPSRPFGAILEALTLAMVCLFGFLYMTTGIRIRTVLLHHPNGLRGLHRSNAAAQPDV
ncbi:MAG TPA: hypothetical protein VN833_08940 [Candidatus Acidoferrales bacterium]|nr:hypothetical protein [Candidatus Acidoferrales bacterium]